MRIHDGKTLYSPSDLVAFLGCEHRSTLDLRRLAGWDQQPAAPDAAAALVQHYGDLHERAHLAKLQQQGGRVATIERDAPLHEQVAATRRAMAAGAEVIYQAALLQPPFAGYADFLLRVPGASALGDYHYELIDTKLAGSNKAKFMVQLGVYADLLAEEQGRLPEHLHVELGTSRRRTNTDTDAHDTRRTADFIHYVRAARARFLQFVQAAPLTRAVPNSACGQCGWREHCEAQWEAADHLSRVANIRSDQVAKLEGAGISTLRALAQTSTANVKGIGAETLARLKRQAALQAEPFDADGRRRIELRAAARGAEGKPRGFALLPEPDPGDLYFDMEGFPYEPGGLEYLFGVGWFEQGDRSRWTFRAFWAHDRHAEKQAFEQFMDFVEAHLAHFGNAHIYHYAPYEHTAIERLSSVHDTRVDLRDRLLREGRLVDLYQVVSGALLLALPGYSIKKVEAYYRGQRQGGVVDAGQSIVQYEAFRAATDEAMRARLLQQIEDYNRDDVESTQQLHAWLESLRPAGVPRFVQATAGDGADEAKPNVHAVRQAAALAKLSGWVAGTAPAARADAARLAEIVGQSLGFYWRCKLPTLWRKYKRQTAEEATLLDDQDCLAQLEFTGKTTVEKRSIRYHCRVPEQPHKLGTGSAVTCLTDGLPASNLILDEEAHTASFTRGAQQDPPPPVLTLVLDDQVSQAKKLDAIHAFVDRLCASAPGHEALLNLLLQRPPVLAGRKAGSAVADDLSIPSITAAVRALHHSHLVIQGPPGTGKTTTASQVIAALLGDGKRVAISSNSHAAINHLLMASVQRCADAGLNVKAAVVKADDAVPEGIDVLDPDALDSATHPLAGGTAFLLCRPAQVLQWDYLFIDEASQVSLADVIAAGQCASNIVLLGDQMQLAQPTQGIHPGQSGLSALDYLMQGHATVPPEQGIFLGTTHRMHPQVCKPVSEGIYEGRLASAPRCATQRLLLGNDADPALRATGVVHVPVVHHDCSQSSVQEVDRIETLYRSLLCQSWVDASGAQGPISAADVIVLAPYNAQVRALKQRLGPDARVGTVDKFQGQEAAVAILSMTTSDAENMPRGVDFLFSRNRLNVGVSRAKCLALIVASPALRTAVCQRVDDVPLLNLYCLLTAGQYNSGTTATWLMPTQDPFPSLNQEFHMDNGSQSEQLPHYVYVLVDPDTKIVFYVGKGQGTRVFAHWAELKRLTNWSESSQSPKLARLRAIESRGKEPMQVIVGRFEAADQAFAAETILINWMYGFEHLTNKNRGQNCDWVRQKDDWSKQPHLDVGERQRVQDGSFRDKKVQGLTAAGAYDYLNNLTRTLCDAGFEVRDFTAPRDKSYHPGESNGWLGLLVKIEGIDFMVVFGKTKTPSLWIANTKETQDNQGALAQVGWDDLGDPMNQRVNGVGRYRPFVQAGAKGSIKFPGEDGVSSLVKELERRREALQSTSRPSRDPMTT